jgi:hypothetical protein
VCDWVLLCAGGIAETINRGRDLGGTTAGVSAASPAWRSMHIMCVDVES